MKYAHLFVSQVVVAITLMSSGVMASELTCISSATATELTVNMETAIGGIRDILNNLLGIQICPFTCQSNVSLIQAALESIENTFNETIAIYNGIIGDDLELDCPPPPPCTTCSVLSLQLAGLIANYTLEYVPNFGIYTVTLTTSGECPNRATELRALVGNYLCIIVNLLESLDPCSEACDMASVCTTPLFETTVTGTMNNATSLLTSAISLIGDYCSLPENTNCSDIAQASNDLALAETLFNATIATFTARINQGSYNPPACSITSSACNCTAMAALGAQVGPLITQFTDEWLALLVNNNTNTCVASLTGLRELVAQLLCITSALKTSLSTCSCACSTLPLQSALLQNMNLAIGLIRSTLAALPNPCVNFTSFCNSTVSLIVAQGLLSQAKTLLATAIFTLYVILQEVPVPLTCPAILAECSCGLINGLLTDLLTSYTSEAEPLLEALLAGSGMEDCATTASGLLGFVTDYYCIVDRVLANIAACLAVCNNPIGPSRYCCRGTRRNLITRLLGGGRVQKDNGDDRPLSNLDQQ